MVAATKVVAAAAKVMAVAPKVLVVAARLRPELLRLGLWMWRRLQRRPRYWLLQPVVAKVASLPTTRRRKESILWLVL